MKIEVFVTNTSSRAVSTRYRLDNKNIVTITIQPRALSNKLTFATKNEFDLWRSQNTVFFDKGILICSTADKAHTEKEAMAKSQETARKESQKAHEQANKAADKAEVVAKESNATLKMNLVESGKKHD